MISATYYRFMSFVHCKTKIENFIEFCHCVYTHAAPVTTLHAWTRQSEALSHTLLDMDAIPGITVGGYHHSWIERAVRLYRRAAEGRQAPLTLEHIATLLLLIVVHTAAPLPLQHHMYLLLCLVMSYFLIRVWWLKAAVMKVESVSDLCSLSVDQKSYIQALCRDPTEKCDTMFRSLQYDDLPELFSMWTCLLLCREVACILTTTMSNVWVQYHHHYQYLVLLH